MVRSVVACCENYWLIKSLAIETVGIKLEEEYTMTETIQMNNTTDKIATLTKEAENLKLKLEEERQKLNDVACKFSIVF